MTSALQTQILSSSGITSCDSSFQCALDNFSTLCGAKDLSGTTSSPAPKLIKFFAKSHFDVIETSLASHYVPSPRQISIMSCIRAPHAQDLLFTIPIDRLGQRMFNWSQGKDACLDVTDISPFAGGGVSSWAPGSGVAKCGGKEKKSSILGFALIMIIPLSHLPSLLLGN
ncbi:hypothetical protein AgCh_011028 [Apium graveolens]